MTLAEGTIVMASLDAAAAGETGPALLRAFGYGPEPDPACRWHRPGLVSLRVRAATDPDVLDRVRALPGMERVSAVDGPLTGPHSPLAPLSEVRLPGGATIGGDALTVIAGPCSCESADQVLRTAECVAEAGARALRGGTFKARTSPYAFGGLGERGLEYLARARERTGLPVVTEALESGQLDAVARLADVIQIGSRNMQNFPLLFDAGAHPSGRPVLLKRGLAATHEEFLQAAEYVLVGRVLAGHAAAGLILCERGIRTFDDALRFTLDVGAIPVLQSRSGLPVIADPSHAAGKRRFVAPLARAAVAAGAAGLLIEVHPAPDTAWSDGPQSLSFPEFRTLMRGIAGFVPPRD